MIVRRMACYASPRWSLRDYVSRCKEGAGMVVSLPMLGNICLKKQSNAIPCLIPSSVALQRTSVDYIFFLVPCTCWQQEGEKDKDKERARGRCRW